MSNHDAGDQNSTVDSLLASLLIKETDAGAGDATTVQLSISNIFPTEVQKIILSHLGWRDLLYLRAVNCNYRNIIANEIQDVWKARHDARWRNGKRRATRLTPKGFEQWSRTQQWTVHPEDVVDDNWFREFIRRCQLDGSVATRLITLGVERPQANETWYSLMVDGLDIVDCLKKFIYGQRGDASKAFLKEHVRKPPSSLQVIAEKVLTGISRVVSYQEWKFLHDHPSTIEMSERRDDKVQLEDGAIAIAKFYDIVIGNSSRKIHECAEDYVLKELDRLAYVIRGRLVMRSCVTIESNYPLLEVVDEMKFLFNNSGATNDDGSLAAFRGNVDDYYDHTNSLICNCLANKTGIPITLAVIYTAIVRRVCGVQMDIIGLPGHIVVGVPSNDVVNASRLFVDPFHEGRILSYADCQGIVARYNMAFRDEMVKPISNEQVWERMVRNLIHSHSMQALADDNDNESESNQEWKIAIPLRYLLSDFAHRITDFRDLVNAPGWCPQFC